MLIFYIALFGVACLAGGVILEEKSYESQSAQKTSIFFGIASLVIAAIMGIIVLISYPTSLNTVSKMENFYERNHDIYKNGVETFPDATTVKTKEGTVETVKLSWDYTHEVLSYNENLKWYRRYQNNWFYGVFVAKLPADLVFIDLK